jgi:hypothetical protein
LADGDDKLDEALLFSPDVGEGAKLQGLSKKSGGRWTARRRSMIAASYMSLD